MSTRRFSKACASLASIIAIVSLVQAQESSGDFAAPHAYRQVTIPGIPSQGYTYVFPADINNQGVIVGALNRLPGYVPVRAFLWTGSGPTQDLGDLGVYEFAQALGINDAKQVIGIAEVTAPGDPLGHVIHGFFWQNGVMTDLPPLGGDVESQTVALNERGDVLVVSFDRTNPDHDRYYIWNAGRADQIGRLNAYPGGPSGNATSMNDSRQIVGSVVNEDGKERAFLWQDRQMTDLGFAPGDDFFSVAYKINNGGTIIGESYAFDDQNGHGARSQGVVWQEATLVRTIAPLPDGSYILAPLGENKSGTIVGFSGFPSSAFVSYGGPALDLNTLVSGPLPNKFLYQGRDVNDVGQIVVDGQFGCCGYLLNPM